MTPEVEERAMRAAISASERVRGTTSPNPPVGCVLLDPLGQVVGRGATSPPGGGHAEVNALREAGERAAGGTAVVTLEPCAHTGRTPPCAVALRDAGVSRVVHAVSDPNPSASGGADLLRAAGVDVHSGLLADEVAKGPLRAWLHFVHTGRPHVTWKYAATLDGRSAAADGTSKWISSAESRAEVHQVRAAVDAIIAGTGTILSDDAQLTARDPGGNLVDRQPLRVVIGDRELPPQARVLDDTAETLRLPGGDPAAALAELARRGVVDVLLEGGPTLAGAFWRARLVDRVLAYIAPALLGSGPAALGDAGVGSISQAWRLRIEETTMSGPDVRISAVPQD
ncbi:bifunctional diaminohydroxyphosphoribosylaminopyrimidine deaminase/5-amino-6-(5-phosphoribosylamino)uracil reductase RibD [Saccharopolyspora rhizosphaerae]|uniref:Riboflavin biosynthesis protein RibD n=1 Tax=Saccharopolyspora rhizosphaerae TaxID=2492662 RepID=A0A426JY67_9PSEU|nr:bifunctional diaminohydroxyphosphoribosylaminopyrimidine deaminase/5-amino-6-(5-phosphoribosylamino)uracil reductase RibD [Saccharopolyspora rhizosphaerae]RRO18140.1 bifunctional diaminohydroxyphosphoribosylaminopyrimidine deaminase/5-amino-6-(5-phosphoribosylamino)uracil reductase RibD [Saccharopolyspora rhizosphaerae]